MIEKKIYNGWAFSENASEKAKINREIYEELKNKYKILIYYGDNPSKDVMEDYDIVYSRKAGYNHGEYQVYKAPNEITTNEFLLIFDKGNLCFGGNKEYSNYYRVSED